MVGSYNYDLIVIGGGPAGQRAAVQAAQLRKRVAIVDNQHDLGGVCVHTGTIPSKSFREAVLYLSGYRQRNVYGSSYRIKSDISMEDLNSRCQYMIRVEVENLKAELATHRIEHIRGTSRLEDSHTVVIESSGSRIEKTAEFIFLAPGARPYHVSGIDFDGRTIFDSDDFLTMQQLPKSLTVVGGGVIGLEYASMFAALGTHVTVIDGRRTVLGFVDEEIVENLLFRLRGMGVTFRLGESVESCSPRRDGQVVTTLLSKKVVISECVLFSAGRVSATHDLGLENVGIIPGDRGKIKVNEQFQTDIPTIYAGGDVIGFPALASTSAEQGRLAVCSMFGIPYERQNNTLLPYGIYSIPEIAMVGSRERELTDKGIPYEVGVARYREITKGHLVGDQDGFLKLIFHRESRELLGVHIIGESASDLIHLGQSVMTFGGKLDYFLSTVFNYPTLTNCYKVAALDGWGKLF